VDQTLKEFQQFRDLKKLADQIRRPPVSATPEELWRCYEALESASSRWPTS